MSNKPRRISVKQRASLLNWWVNGGMVWPIISLGEGGLVEAGGLRLRRQQREDLVGGAL
ncbi:MAG: hypothetical protein IH859_06065 [Chloroflexi bacterium]|nr:hypothetical protein [Chloroflexota bacterium]